DALRGHADGDDVHGRHDGRHHDGRKDKEAMSSSMRMTYLAVALVLLAGCPGPRGESTPSKTSTTTGNPQTNPENSTAMNPVMPPQTKMPSAQSPPPAAPAITRPLTGA